MFLRVSAFFMPMLTGASTEDLLLELYEATTDEQLAVAALAEHGDRQALVLVVQDQQCFGLLQVLQAQLLDGGLSVHLPGLFGGRMGLSGTLGLFPVLGFSHIQIGNLLDSLNRAPLLDSY